MMQDLDENTNLLPFYIQTSDDVHGAVVPQTDTEKFIKATEDKLDRISAAVRSLASTISNTINELPVKPEEFACEFGISLGGEAGVPFVTKGSVNTNFKVTLKWKA